MPLYRVQLHGRNFLIEMGGSVAKHGFYVDRDVEADGPEDAEYKAVQKIREHPGLRSAKMNALDDPPMIHLESIREIDEISQIEAGIIFYPEQEAVPWWQFWRSRLPRES